MHSGVYATVPAVDEGGVRIVLEEQGE